MASQAGAEAFKDRMAFAFKAGKGAARQLGASNAVFGAGANLPTRAVGSRGWTKLVGIPGIRYGVDGPEESAPPGLLGKNGLLISVLEGSARLRSAVAAPREEAPETDTAPTPASLGEDSAREVRAASGSPAEPGALEAGSDQDGNAAPLETAEAAAGGGLGDGTSETPPPAADAGPVFDEASVLDSYVPRSAAGEKLKRAMSARGLAPAPDFEAAAMNSASSDVPSIPSIPSSLPARQDQTIEATASARSKPPSGLTAAIGAAVRREADGFSKAEAAPNAPLHEGRRLDSGAGFSDLREILDARGGHLGELLSLARLWRETPPTEPDFDALHRSRLKAEAARMEVSESSVLVRLFQRGEWGKRRQRLSAAERKFRSHRDRERIWSDAQERLKTSERIVVAWSADLDDAVGEWMGNIGIDPKSSFARLLSDDVRDCVLQPYHDVFGLPAPVRKTSYGREGGGYAPLSSQAPLRRWSEMRTLLSSLAGPDAPARMEARMLRENVGPEQALRVRLAVGRVEEALSMGVDLLMHSQRGQLIANADAFADLARDPRTGDRFRAAAADRFLDGMATRTGAAGERSDMMCLADILHAHDPRLGERMRKAAEAAFIPAEESRILAAALSRVRSSIVDRRTKTRTQDASAEIRAPKAAAAPSKPRPAPVGSEEGRRTQEPAARRVIRPAAGGDER